MEIRPMKQEDDRHLIGRIYEKSWKFAYRDIIPQSYLDGLSAEQWVVNLDREGLYTLVAVENGEWIGTAAYCRSRCPEFDGFGEIVAIYFLPGYMRKGYGKELLRAVIRQLKKLGFQDIFLWVLEDNLRARRFYEKEGFSFSGNYREDEIGGKKLREMQYCYRIEFR